MSQTLKIVILAAGWATRLRPQTWSKPKPLIGVAGKTVLEHLLDTFKTAPPEMDVEYVFIVSLGFGAQQIPAYMEKHHPDLKVHYVIQEVMRGQSDALYLAHEHLTGPTLMVFSDTLIETDFSSLDRETANGVAWVKDVPDPRRFGVAKLDPQGWITELEEKPQSFDNTLAVVGCYYFRDGCELVSAIEEQFLRKLQFRDEFFLVHALNIMLERGAKLRTQVVDVWLDTGTIEATLETNRYLLEHGCGNTESVKRTGVTVLPPVFIHETAEIRASVIGPNVSVGAKCVITGSRVENSILEEEAAVESAALNGSFIGRQAQVRGRSAESPPLKLNIGDNSSVVVE